MRSWICAEKAELLSKIEVHTRGAEVPIVRYEIMVLLNFDTPNKVSMLSDILSDTRAQARIEALNDVNSILEGKNKKEQEYKE